ncbi:hypothetical protein I7I50_09792 [Histoplasma capsulatum G186AR]|uniref:Uncharacterized protein n=1 Tax=Ajellomyces capsulatus TaxID=5037 RepID=A0A8H7Z385_AJECA|nr:hypothetical protein I7I52_10891 [Histoplasma capsulatum]QSS68728.1 hypothetical protein I7I50_09792 [Histoplasma capsulatum G186AR]
MYSLFSLPVCVFIIYFRRLSYHTSYMAFSQYPPIPTIDKPSLNIWLAGASGYIFLSSSFPLVVIVAVASAAAVECRFSFHP